MLRYEQSGTEPTLDEVIHEPVIRLMMERDHVTDEALLRIINIARQHLAEITSSSARGSGSSSCPILSSISRFSLLVSRWRGHKIRSTLSAVSRAHRKGKSISGLCRPRAAHRLPCPGL